MLYFFALSCVFFLSLSLDGIKFILFHVFRKIFEFFCSVHIHSKIYRQTQAKSRISCSIFSCKRFFRPQRLIHQRQLLLQLGSFPMFIGPRTGGDRGRSTFVHKRHCRQKQQKARCRRDQNMPHAVKNPSAAGRRFPENGPLHCRRDLPILLLPPEQCRQFSAAIGAMGAMLGTFPA